MSLLLPPDTTALKNVRKLCEITDAYASSDELDSLFVDAFKEIISWHRKNNEFYKKLTCDFDLSKLQSVDDLKDLPFIHANFFKMHEVVSIDEKDVSEHLTSSGTSGQKSQMFFDEWSILAVRRFVKFVYGENGFDTPEKESNYLVLAYEPHEGSKVGTTSTNLFLTSFSKAKEIFFVLRNTAGTHEFDRFGTVAKLQEYAKQDLPVRINGFPSFMYFTLMQMKDMGVKVKLHPDSLAVFGGGWKGYADQQVPKEELYSLMHEYLGINTQRIRDGYGSVEHSVPYLECKNHKFHVPVWSRLFVRDVKTLEVLDYGQSGFMNFVTPYITSVPAVSVMMGDLGVMHRASDCSCGAKTPFFEALGRAGVSQNKSCAVSASELLKKRGV